MQVDLPIEVFSARRRSPEEFVREIAGLDRTDFLLALACEGVDAFAIDVDDLRRELGPG